MTGLEASGKFFEREREALSKAPDAKALVPGRIHEKCFGDFLKNDYGGPFIMEVLEKGYSLSLVQCPPGVALAHQ